MKRILLFLFTLLILLSASGCKSIFHIEFGNRKSQNGNDQINHGINIENVPGVNNESAVSESNFELYYDLNTAKGLELYVWEIEYDVFCGIMTGTNRNKTGDENEYIKQNPATFDQMKKILKTYNEVDIIIISNETDISGNDIYKALDIEQ